MMVIKMSGRLSWPIMSFNLSFLSSSFALGLSVVLTSIYVIRTIRYYATHRLPPGPEGIPFSSVTCFSCRRRRHPGKSWRSGGRNMESRLKILPHVLRTLIDPPTTDSSMYITAAGTGMLVLNSHNAANDLLERWSQVYNDRPRFISKC